MGRPSRYAREVRERAVRMVLDHEAEPGLTTVSKMSLSSGMSILAMSSVDSSVTPLRRTPRLGGGVRFANHSRYT